MSELVGGGGAYMGRRRSTGGIGLRPANFISEFGGSGEVRGFHNLEVLLVLRRRAGCDLVEPFAGVGFIDSVETAEGGEELVMAAGAGTGNKAAH